MSKINSLIQYTVFGGEEVIHRPPPLVPPGEPHPFSKRKPTRPNGYATTPGTGPDGETCKSCVNHRRVEYHDKHYQKCALIEHRWTHGTGSDIILKSPACELWGEK